MALNKERVADPQFLPATTGALVTCPASKKVIWKGFLLHNVTDAVATASLWLVPNSGGSVGTAGNVHKILGGDEGLVITAGETIVFDFPAPLYLDEENDTIQGSSDTVNAVTFNPFADTETL
jgi:hypothetical protein